MNIIGILVRSIRCSESELVRQMRSEEPQSAYRRNVVPAIIVCVCQRNNIANYVFVIARKNDEDWSAVRLTSAFYTSFNTHFA